MLVRRYSFVREGIRVSFVRGASGSACQSTIRAASCRATSAPHRTRASPLHPVAILVGIVGTATVIGGFVGSLPSFVAVLLNNVAFI
jgi:hypothetical protein